MKTALTCGAMNLVWVGLLSFLALQDHRDPDPRTVIGMAAAWLLATAAAWLLFRHAGELLWWQLAVWTFLVTIVALVLVTIGAALVWPTTAGPG